MRANYLQTYWEDQSLVFRQQLESIRRRPSKKNIHDFRVSVKKLKSTGKLVHLAFPDANLPRLELIPHFFKVAGHLRDWDMSRQLLGSLLRKENSDLPVQRKTMAALHRISRDQTLTAAMEPLASELAQFSGELHAVLQGYPDAELEARVQDIARQQLDQLMERLEQWPDQAHALRKKGKRLYYWMDACPVNSLFGPKQFRQLHQCLQALGHWHDHQVLRQRVRACSKLALVKTAAEKERSQKIEAVLQLLGEQWLAKAREEWKKIK